MGWNFRAENKNDVQQLVGCHGFGVYREVTVDLELEI